MTHDLVWAAEHGWSSPPLPKEPPRRIAIPTFDAMDAAIARNRKARKLTVIGPEGEPLEVPRS